MESMIYITLFIAIAALSGLFFQTTLGRRLLVQDRLEAIETSYGITEEEDDLRKPFLERVINPAYHKFVDSIGKITPKSILKKYELLLIQSGLDRKFTANSILAIQIMLSVVMAGLFYVVTQFLSGQSNILISLLFGAIGFFLPYSRISTASQVRQKQIQKALPDLLDILYISVEAGLGFDAALKKSASKMPGPLSDEIRKALDDMSKGRERQDALKALIKRTGVEDVTTFITAVIQSEQLGTNIANMLRIQSTVMRQKRRQRAEEAAMKIPLKMLFPLIFFMFPALFVVILGPAVISMIENLGGLL